MLINPVQGFAYFSAVAACCGIIYNFLCLWSGWKFARKRKVRSGQEPAAAAHPPVTFLKPLRGTDPEMYESLRSHCLLDYPDYEILFAVHEPDDPALKLVERLQKEFPNRNIRFLVCTKILGANIKMSNLAQLLPLASHECFVVNDSDIRVRPDYLQQIMRPFADDHVGLVTCLYRGKAADSLGSRLEALGISTDFSCGVLMAQALEGEVRFGLGSTLAFRKKDLERAGGFEALVDYLADDYELGARISQGGQKIEISDTVVETFLPRYQWRDFVSHQLRWLRGIRNSRPGGYFGLCLTYAIPWAILAVALTRGSWWAWLLLAISVALRFVVAFTIGEKVLQDGQLRSFGWLVPVRDCIALVLWAAAYAGRTVHWRGDRFRLNRGKLFRDAGHSSPPA